MALAQRLYEDGKITYMRTDSVNLSNLALAASRDEITATMGERYVHTRRFTTHSKGAQEAHEAIRPTYMNVHTAGGNAQEQRLYELVWKRTIASQMADAELEKTVITIGAGGQQYQFVATGEVVVFDGFLRVYRESTDDEPEGDDAATLPAMERGGAALRPRGDGATTLLAAPAPLQRGEPGAQARRAGHRPPLDLRAHHIDHTKPQIRGKGSRPAQRRTCNVLTLRGDHLSDEEVAESYGGGEEQALPPPTRAWW